jgi:glycosyltransferase involved in cell wall biosynthesis
MNYKISVVAPLHNEEGNAMPLYLAIKETMDKLGFLYEIIFVNDFSSDRTFDIMREIQKNDKNFHYCNLAYNAGENWAFFAGFSKARGEIIVTIDGDFQNDPKFIPDLLRELKKGYRAVSGWRKNRVGGFFNRILPSFAANYFISILSGVRIHDCGCGLRAFRREVVAGKFVPSGFMNRFAPVIFGVNRHEFSEVVVEDRMRTAGKSHYGLERIFIVLNDLFVLPFALRGPQQMRKWTMMFMIVFGFTFLIIVVSAVSGLFTATPFVVTVLVVLFFLFIIFTSIHWNLGRFIEAQKNPYFKIKEFK